MTNNKMHVLLIEDNLADAALVTGLLTKDNHESIDIECASTLSKAREAVKHGGVDIILLDLNLPDSQGLETFNSIYQQSPQTPIVILTGVDNELVGTQAVQLGAQDYLVKSQLSDIRLLRRAIHYAIERSRLKIESERLNKIREEAELKNAVLEERNRIARDLHDSLTQTLYSLTLWAEAGRRIASEGVMHLAEEYFAHMGGLSQQALKEMRLLVYELHPLDLGAHGLISSVQRRLDAVESRAGIKAVLEVEGTLDLSQKMQEGLYRIIQESLNNALKHSGAELVLVNLTASPEEFELKVSDNGNGFDPSAAFDGGGLGIPGMKARAGELGGTLTICSRLGAGTNIVAKFPFATALPDIN